MNATKLLEQEKTGFARIEAPCPYFGRCGGCALQDLSYEDQLRFKHRRLQQTLNTLEGMPPVTLVGCEPPWRYRNKAEFTFGQVDGRLVLGYHAAGSFWRVVDLEDCLLLPEPVMLIVRQVWAMARASGLPAYHPKTHQGFFRYACVRHSGATGQVLLCLMTAPGPSGVIEPMAQELMARHPSLCSVWWGVSAKWADVAWPDTLQLLGGAPHLEDQVGPFHVRVHPLSFLQPNTLQAERLYETLKASTLPLAGAAGGGVAWDLYCGLGLVSFYLADRFRRVYGIDVEDRSIELAKEHALTNGVSNVEFRVGLVERLLTDRRFWLQEAKPDVVVVDPPRVGLHPQALSSVLAARPLAIAYLSCNAQSLVRDLQGLLAGFPRYRVTRVHAFDMFPQTNHLETLVLLERASSNS